MSLRAIPPSFRKILRWASSSAGYAALDESRGAYGCTWTAGGCALFAFAVAEVIAGAEVWVIGERRAGRRSILHHLCVRAGGVWYDGTGFLGPDAREVLAGYREKEGVRVTSIRVAQWEEINLRGEIPCDRRDVYRVARFMRRALGR